MTMPPSDTVEAADVEPDPMLPVLLPVLRHNRHNHDTFDLLIDTRPLGGLGFLPGQFNMLYVFGVGEVPISISSDPRRTDRLVHTIREVGTVTRALGRLARGTLVGLRGPFGTAWPLQEAQGNDVLVIAGGIGLASLKPAVHAVLAQQRAYGRLFVLYGTRTPDDVLFKSELMGFGRRRHVSVEVTVERGDPGWHGHTGVVTKLLDRTSFDPKHAVAMLCGPEVMMRFCANDLVGMGLAPSKIFISAERNMKCALGFCGHCQLGQHFVCKDGPVFNYERISLLLSTREV